MNGFFKGKVKQIVLRNKTIKGCIIYLPLAPGPPTPPARRQTPGSLAGACVSNRDGRRDFRRF